MCDYISEFTFLNSCFPVEFLEIIAELVDGKAEINDGHLLEALTATNLIHQFCYKSYALENILQKLIFTNIEHALKTYLMSEVWGNYISSFVLRT